MNEIRALTVRQPWAWAIIHGGKDVDNRSRNIAGAYRGPVLIHAGLTDDDEGYRMLGPKTGPFATWTDDLVDEGLSSSSERGVFIGVVDLVDAHRSDDALQCCHEVVNSDDSFWFDPVCSPWAQAVTGTWHLVLTNPRPLPKPIPYKGSLGLWRIDTDEVPGSEALL